MIKKTHFLVFFILSNFFVAFSDQKIAVVDEQVLIDQYQRSVDLVKRLEGRFRLEEQKMKNLESNLIDLEKEMMTAGNAKKEKLIEKMSKMKIEYKINKEYLTEMLNVQRNQYTMQVLKDIQKAIDDIAKDKGYDLVLRKSFPGPRGVEKQHLVFYNKKELDITQEVLKYLNLKFKQEKSAK